MTQTRILRYGHQDFQLLEKNTRYQGFFKLDQYKVTHKRFDGSESEVLTREVFERDDAVVLIPYDPVSDSVVLIEQFRPGAIRAGDTPWMLEFIAGMFKQGESPVEVAIREAKEEANLTIAPASVSNVMKYLSSPGGMSEAMYVYLALIDSSTAGGVHGLDEEGEDILVHVVKRQQALELLKQGKIANAATVIGLQWLALNYQAFQSS
ncbi:ADP-ribose pyrophosphatase [Thalassotalea insulae]|uniref:ADP-ribose pyrophosphatase n=1 Tax=Thalassotalea insulae TaxID=2056778 RepID=A0ABQ6GUH4_9GAMM|nr:NUDIX domain-containing protein [Thalassotalea insulae]GLX79573.1 ADP-ribose pyrophosphatase [Thalassotalea insulae]